MKLIVDNIIKNFDKKEVLKKGYKLKEVPVSMNERIGGTSSIKAWKNIYYMVNVCLSILMVKIRRYK